MSTKSQQTRQGETRKRRGQALVGSVLFHIVLAAMVGLLGFHFANYTRPEVMEVVLEGGSSGPAPQETPPEEQPVEQPPEPEEIPEPDPIVEKQEQPKPKPQPKVSKPATTPKYTAPGGTGDGNSPVDTGGKGTGKGDGEGSGEGRGVPETPPYLRSSKQPKYPGSARSKGIEGTVMVRMMVNTSGSVDSAAVSSSSGDGSLDQAAVDAVYSWRFSPAKDRYGTAVPCYITVPVTFRLK